MVGYLHSVVGVLGGTPIISGPTPRPVDGHGPHQELLDRAALRRLSARPLIREISAEGLDFSARSRSPPSFEALARPAGHGIMFENPTSATDRSRAPSRPICLQPPLDTIPGSSGAIPPGTLRAADRHLLALLGEHEVLTSSQLVRLTAMPERTAQYRLGVLYRAGLVNRHRPHATIGTCSYHVWLTPFGAAAIGAEPPRPWSEDLAGLRTMAALCDLWLGLRDHGPGVGLVVTNGRRLRAGVTYADRRTGAERRVLADAELTAHVGPGGRIEALLVARVDHIPAPRLASVVGRWADYFAAAPESEPRMALVLTRSARHRAAVLAAARGAGDTPTIRNQDQPAPLRAHRRVAVGLVGQPAALVHEPVWRSAADEADHRLVEVLAGLAEVGR